MKLKNIAGICKKAKRVVVYEKVDGETGEVQQYIGDGAAIYPAYGLPYVEKDNLLAIFDVPEKQRDDIYFVKDALPDAFDMRDTTPNERFLKAEDIMLISGGRMLKAFDTSEGMVFIDTKYIKPMADVLDVIDYFERETPAGQIYIAAKAGYLLQAVIMPVDTISEDFTKHIESMAVMCRNALELSRARRMAEDDEEPEQTVLFDDEGEDE